MPGAFVPGIFLCPEAWFVLAARHAKQGVGRWSGGARTRADACIEQAGTEKEEVCMQPLEPALKIDKVLHL